MVQLGLHLANHFVHLLDLLVLLGQKLLGVFVQVLLGLGRGIDALLPLFQQSGLVGLFQLGETLDPVVFVVDVVGDILEILHVGLDEKPPEKSEIRMFGVVHFHESPRVLSPPHLFPVDLKQNRIFFSRICL